MLNVISVILSTFLLAIFIGLLVTGMTQLCIAFGVIASLVLFTVQLYLLIEKATSDSK